MQASATSGGAQLASLSVVIEQLTICCTHPVVLV